MAEPLAPLVRLVEAGVLACVAWLALLAVLALGARLPGALGRDVRRLARALAPVALHATLGLAVGAVGLAGPARAAERPAPPAVSLDWPGTTGTGGPAPTVGAPTVTTGRPSPASPSDTPSPSAASGTPSPLPDAATPVDDADQVVVRVGDSLWALAARDLGARATPARVAHAWPQWWTANRSVIGDDPDLIHPGTVLDRPDRPQESP